MPVSCAVGLPNVGEYGDPLLLVQLAREAEAAGWAGAFVWDHVAYEPGWAVADPYMTVAAIAAQTARIRLGVLVSAVARRRPTKLARELATLDLLSGGRLVVGAGLGSSAEEQFTAFGEDADPRVRAQKLDEGLEIVDALWRGEPYEFAGRHEQVRTTGFLPRPEQRPRPPVWIAGRWPGTRPFRRAARWDGVFPIFADELNDANAPVSALQEVVAYVREQRGERGGPFDVVIEGASNGPDTALLAPYEQAGLTWWIEKLGWFRGPLDEMRERIARGPPA
ncbi:LLM class flavin-dependent oxidoreductase [Conexibacter stalactiti]|uniref:LLM class flavin-dependent oxidoreductase n=1 Tax=Conexibacter stalactiti TaxID=1940611 RepID=A0ABU4HNP4_9ACTN|nr:LLM class flavin-dependent oxidoreductase [Conexibacter stalactiti]MDW5594897.1 LLM class flavin-dependent oxidoreductase [Conexibacter stalactiti]MEC5035539.1 LLM class flavin-dependent oxidoreductase [Conexibacter stalactiti]